MHTIYEVSGLNVASDLDYSFLVKPKYIQFKYLGLCHPFNHSQVKLLAQKLASVRGSLPPGRENKTKFLGSGFDMAHG